MVARAQDKVEWCMACIRAAERCNVERMVECATAYKEISSICDVSNPEMRSTPNFQELKKHTVKMAQESIFEDMEEAKLACQHYGIVVKASKVRLPTGGSRTEDIIFWRHGTFKEPKDPCAHVAVLAHLCLPAPTRLRPSVSK